MEDILAKARAALQCPICQGELKRPASIPCGHDFCEACIILSLETNGTKCPVCNHPCWRSSIVRNQMLENILYRLQDAKPPSSLPSQSGKGRSPKVVAPPKLGSKEEAAEEVENINPNKRSHRQTRQDLAEGSKHQKKAQVPVDTAPAAMHRKAKRRRGQGGGGPPKGANDRDASPATKRQEVQSPGRDTSANRSARNASQKTSLPGEAEGRQTGLAGSGVPTFAVGEVGVIPESADMEELLSTPEERQLEEVIAAQEDELRNLDGELLIMGIPKEDLC